MQQFLHIKSICHLYFLDFVVVVLFFYPVWRINIWTTKFTIYVMTFVTHKLSCIKNRITSSGLVFLVSWTICIIIGCRFYFVTPWVYYMSIFWVSFEYTRWVSFEEIKLIANFNWIFHVSELWRSIIISLM